MGAWNFVDRRIEKVLGRLDSKAQRPIYVGREAAASPATGSARMHAASRRRWSPRRWASAEQAAGTVDGDRDQGAHAGRKRHLGDRRALDEAGRRRGRRRRAAGGAGDRQGHGRGQRAGRRRADVDRACRRAARSRSAPCWRMLEAGASCGRPPAPPPRQPAALPPAPRAAANPPAGVQSAAAARCGPCRAPAPPPADVAALRRCPPPPS